jgi:hypothetical protein
MHSLNRQRANIVFSTLVDKDVVLTPEQVAAQERVFERDGILRWRASTMLGYCSIGSSFNSLLRSFGTAEPFSGAFRGAVQSQVSELMMLYSGEEYVCWYDVQRRQAYIILKEGASQISQLKAWSHMLNVAKQATIAKTGYEQHVATVSHKKANVRDTGMRQFHETAKLLQESLRDHSASFDAHAERLKAAGWDLDMAVLETRPGYRFAVVEADE